MITTEKIKIFDNYGGDIDCLARVGRDYEKELFDNNEWSLIDNFYQDIELINKRLVAQTYIEQTFVKLKENCDFYSFQTFAGKIECYNDFQKVVNILNQIKTFVSEETDTFWAGFDSPEKFLEDINQDIEKIENCDYQTLEKVNIEFAPTCTYQELSLTNGWSQRYLELSSDFDKIYERITKGKTAQKSTLPNSVRSWWQKLFSSK